MIKYTNEELLDVLPPSLRESKELTTKQKVILGQFMVYNGLDIVTKDGYFYRSNKDLCSDCDVQEKTLIAAVNKLVMLGFIERKSGSRKEGASQYRINQKMIADYCRISIDDNCKKEIEDYSNDYSKQIFEMTNKIKELEITVKRLAERITVIETANYSTDKEKDIDKDKEKDIINNTILNNILGKTENTKELESEDSFAESLALSPIEDSTDLEELCASTVDDSEIEGQPTINEEYVPTDKEKEIWKGCLKLINPYLAKMQTVTSTMKVDGIKDEIMSKAKRYFNSIDGVTDWVLLEFGKRVAEYTIARHSELEELSKKEIKKQLQHSSQYAAFC